MRTKYEPWSRWMGTSPPQHTEMAATAAVVGLETSAPRALAKFVFSFIYFYLLTFFLFTIRLHAHEVRTSMTTNGHVTTSTHRNGGNSSRSGGSRTVCTWRPSQVHFLFIYFYSTNFFFLQFDYMRTKYKPLAVRRWVPSASSCLPPPPTSHDDSLGVPSASLCPPPPPTSREDSLVVPSASICPPPLPTILSKVRLGFEGSRRGGVSGATITGPNDASGIIWALGMCFFSFLGVCNLGVRFSVGYWRRWNDGGETQHWRHCRGEFRTRIGEIMRYRMGRKGVNYLLEQADFKHVLSVQKWK
jgi:hypothetical protein